MSNDIGTDGTFLTRESIEALRAVGLHIGAEPFFDGNHVAYPNGYLVIKPTSTPGNHISGWEAWFTNCRGMQEQSDAPSVTVYLKDKVWQYEVWEYTPGPGPGDFRRCVSDERDLIERLKEYFFSENADFEALKTAQNTWRVALPLERQIK